MDDSFENDNSENELELDDSEIDLDMLNDSDKEECEDHKKYPHKVYSFSEVTQYMMDTIKETEVVLGLSSRMTWTLLQNFKWDSSKLIEKFYNSDQDEIFAKAHILNPQGRIDGLQSPKKKIKTDLNSECSICLLNEEPMFGLDDCNHSFCLNCWDVYLTQKIINEGISQNIKCAAYKCQARINYCDVLQLTKNKEARSRYQYLMLKCFIEGSKLLKWCPKPGCEYIIKVKFADEKPVRCNCGMLFCFGCGENWHVPINCELLKKWIKKNNDDSESLNWISINTKTCPKCGSSIEKNGGCNYMRCRTSVCKAEFCWICLETLPNETVFFKHQCPGSCRENTLTFQESQLALEKYLRCFEHYMKHLESSKFEKNLYAIAEMRMQDLQNEFCLSWIEVQYLKTSVDILCLCRQTLMYSHVFSFYVKQNNQYKIFTDNQLDLEAVTENLSGYLESEITKENYQKVKTEVLDKLKYCEKRRKVLIEHIKEGSEKDWKKYLSLAEQDLFDIIEFFMILNLKDIFLQDQYEVLELKNVFLA